MAVEIEGMWDRNGALQLVPGICHKILPGISSARRGASAVDDCQSFLLSCSVLAMGHNSGFLSKRNLFRNIF